MDSLDNQLARYRAMEKDAKTLAQDHVLTVEPVSYTHLMDCGVFGFDKVWAFSLSASRRNFILLLLRACSLYGRAFLYPFFNQKETKTLSLPQPTLWFRFCHQLKHRNWRKLLWRKSIFGIITRIIHRTLSLIHIYERFFFPKRVFRADFRGTEYAGRWGEWCTLN